MSKVTMLMVNTALGPIKRRLEGLERATIKLGEVTLALLDFKETVSTMLVDAVTAIKTLDERLLKLESNDEKENKSTPFPSSSKLPN